MKQISDIKGRWKLNNGTEIPYLGLGLYGLQEGTETIDTVLNATEAGYRHFDTAAFYQNEKSLGIAIKQTGLNREEFFITTKVWNTDQGDSNTLKAFQKSLTLLDMDYVDLYLVHWPVKSLYNETWSALEHLYKQGNIKAIGVSNFLQPNLEQILCRKEIIPAVNQCEFHPRLIQQDLIDFCNRNNIQYQAWSPLMQGKIFLITELRSLARKYGKSIAQITLRWNLQKGVITIPKTSSPKRLIENADIFNFSLCEDDMQLIDSLDCNSRIGPYPPEINF